MVNLTKAHDELFRRTADESFSTFEELHDHCRKQKEASTDVWQMPQTLKPFSDENGVRLSVEGRDDVRMNDWSFTQLCRLSRVNKDTLNRLSAKTASLALEETLPSSNKPVQLLTTNQTVRSMHGLAYTRLWNADLLDVVQEFASDFQRPQDAANNGTGLYCGEQDMFAFLIDPTGWAEIDGEAFAPGFFVWNSEVGRRSLGIQTFWFQSICSNHIVWDAVEVVEFTRKHTANVNDGLDKIRTIIDRLVAQKSARRDSFVRVMQQAMTAKCGETADDVRKLLVNGKIPNSLVNDAMEIAGKKGAFTIYSIVDALTRLTQRVRYAGDRMEIDSRIGALLKLVV